MNVAVPYERMIPLTRFDQLRTGSTSMSKLGKQFTGPDCRRVDVVVPRSCAVADFPWVTSAAVADRDLVSRGVRSVLRAEYGVDDTPVATEYILQGTESSPLASVYRAHLEQCGATVLSRVDGAPARWTLGERDELAIAVAGVTVVTVISRDERVDAAELLDEAVRLAR